MTVSTRIAHKSTSLSKIQRRHDGRQGPVPKYIDSTRSSENSYIITPKLESEMRSICLERRAQGNQTRAMKTDAAITTTGIITFGKEAQPIFDALPKHEQDALYHAAAAAIAHDLNTTLTGLTAHRDESAPHAHYQMPAFDMTGKPLSKVIDRERAKKLQDIVGSVFKKYDIHRGTPKDVRVARGDGYAQIINRSVKQLHEDLPKEIAKAKQMLADAIERRDTNIARVAKAEADLLKATAEKEAAITKRLGVYQEREQKAAIAIADLETRLAYLQETAARLKTTVDAIPVPAVKYIDATIETAPGLLGVGRKTEVQRLYTPDSVNAVVKAYNEREKAVLHKASMEVASTKKQYEQKSTALLKRESEAAEREKMQNDRKKAQDTREERLTEKTRGLIDLTATLKRIDEVHNKDTSPLRDLADKDPVGTANRVLTLESQIRYGVIVKVTPERVMIPDQEATVAQKAAALYRTAKEQAKAYEWKGISFEIQSKEMAQHIHKYASDDRLSVSIKVNQREYEPPTRSRAPGDDEDERRRRAAPGMSR